MLKRTEVTFYDTFTYAPKPPQVHITHDKFYFAFALQDPATYNPFVDEGVYYVKASFKFAAISVLVFSQIQSSEKRYSFF